MTDTLRGHNSKKSKKSPNSKHHNSKRNDETTMKRHKKEKMSKKSSDVNDDNIEKQYERSRAFNNHNWNNSIKKVHALPIKRNGKVIQVLKDEKNVITNYDDDSDDIDEEVEGDDVDDDDNVDDILDETNISKGSKLPKESGNSRIDKLTLNECLSQIADICTASTTDPEKSLSRGSKKGIPEDERRLAEIFEYLSHPNIEVVEIAMLSTLIVFKDIIPGYRIRTENVDSSKVDDGSNNKEGIKLKKETQKLQDFEVSLLKTYRRYLNFLDDMIKKTINKSDKKLIAEIEDGTSNTSIKIGISALRCQCELLRSVPHFNYRSILLTSVITYATKSCEDINSLCCSTLEHIFKNDISADTTYEAIIILVKALTNCKYDVPVNLIKTLEYVKLSVHSDQSKSIRTKAKQEKRKRKRDTDGVESILLETSATIDKTSYKRFQLDCLKEMILIYFRIIKMKIGFALIPIALDGLSRITHLINVDTAEDLISYMKGILEANTINLPYQVKLHCILCALRTLTGPGQELNIDDEVFLVNLINLMQDVPSDYDRWDQILESIELFLIKKREPRNNVVVSIVKLLFICSSSVICSTISSAILSLAHTVLLRYPRARSSIYALSLVSHQEDDECVDMAMKALRKEHTAEGISSGISGGEIDGDGSWILPLYNHHFDKKLNKIVSIVMSKEIKNIPLRISEGRYDSDRMVELAEIACNQTADKIHTSSSNSSNNNGNNSTSQQAKHNSFHNNHGKNRKGNTNSGINTAESKMIFSCSEPSSCIPSSKSNSSTKGSISSSFHMLYSVR